MPTVIIGGGLAGLTAANVAADHGHIVTLLESHSRVGGRARTDECDGQLFNQGPHALYLKGAGLRVLRQLGIDPSGGVPPVKGALGVVGGRIGELPSGPASLLRTQLIRGRERVELARVLARVPRIRTAGLADRSTREWLEETFASDRVRDLVAALARVASYAADADLLSADVGVGQLQLALENVRYLDGGWQQIVDALAMRGRAAGVDIRTRVPVMSMRHAPGGWRVETESEAFDADTVIVAVSSPRLAGRLIGSNAILDWAESSRPIAAATLDVGLRELPVSSRRFAVGIDAPLYYSVHNPPARLGAGVTLHVMKYLSRHDDDPSDAVRSQLEDFLELLQPEWRQVAVTSRFMRRMVVSNVIPTAASGGAGGRFGVTVPDQDGVLVAGDWVGPTGHLGDAAISSGKAAADVAANARLVGA
ncbi:MAG: FAD-dependent oxidoreductase [Acidimicrobiia bacterium]|nr:FAD-dependent oxidoreductase [Acidimicrobiia bacterium]